MESILPYIQIVLAVFLVAAILMQQSEAGLGSLFGGGDTGGAKHTRRGFEQTLFTATIVLAVLFSLSALAGFLF
jgi:protein translocase SecG subunit